MRRSAGHRPGVPAVAEPLAGPVAGVVGEGAGPGEALGLELALDHREGPVALVGEDGGPRPVERAALDDEDLRLLAGLEQAEHLVGGVARGEPRRRGALGVVRGHGASRVAMRSGRAPSGSQGDPAGQRDRRRGAEPRGRRAVVVTSSPPHGSGPAGRRARRFVASQPGPPRASDYRRTQWAVGAHVPGQAQRPGARCQSVAGSTSTPMAASGPEATRSARSRWATPSPFSRTLIRRVPGPRTRPRRR